MGNRLIKFLGLRGDILKAVFFHWIRTRIKIPVGASKILVKAVSPPQLLQGTAGGGLWEGKWHLQHGLTQGPAAAPAPSSAAHLLQGLLFTRNSQVWYFRGEFMTYSAPFCQLKANRHRIKSQDRPRSGLKHLCSHLIGVKRCSALAPISLFWTLWSSVWDRGPVSVSEIEEMDSGWAREGLD